MKKLKNIPKVILENPKYSMPAILLLWGILYMTFGAVINRNGGLGFDGSSYGTIIKDFYNILLNDKLNIYQVQRIFPLFLNELLLRIFNLPKENFYIITLFQIYNLILLILCSYIWILISKIYRLDLKYVWLGFIFAFFNFGIAEMTFYYPVLTDTTAFFLGFCLLYFHITDNIYGKILIVITGAFTWASFVYIGILLIIFPVNSKYDFKFTDEKSKTPLNFYLSLLIPLVFFAVSIYNAKEYLAGVSYEDIFTPVFASLLYLDSVLNLILMTFIFYTFLPKNLTLQNIHISVKNILSKINLKNVLLCILIYALINIIQKSLSNDVDPKVSFVTIFYYIAMYGITKPFVYFITAVTYFGPCFIILFFFMKCYKTYLENLGTGVFISFIICFLLLFTSETRLIINFFPFIVLLTVLVMKDFNLSRSMFVLLLIVSFLLSKIYIPMDKIPGDNSFKIHFFSFPDQLFFMNSYTISKLSYFFQGAVIFIMSAFIITKIKKDKKLQSDSGNDLQVTPG
ncbi:MAG: hypothetical protein IPL53_10135 [Ignavibacteria bacterium]|nr:hypothetical protein [Ignavibacteria bacterium]